jgi:hypothetical protein
MKKILFALMFCLPFLMQAQTIGYHENFELPSLGDSVSSSGTPNPWAICTRLYKGGLRCDSTRVTSNDTSYLTTAAFSTIGNSNVILHFSHICKIELLDAGEIEVSVNGGAWTKLTGTQYINPGNSQFVNNSNKFNSNTYPLDWLPTNGTAVPQNTWWKDEQFDISALAGNASSVRVRFALRDGNANGANNNYGWYIDNIYVIMSFSELTPPVITYIAPQFLNTVYNLGPFNIPALIQDASGIGVAKMYYKVNNGALDSVTMTVTGIDTMQATLPAVGTDDSVHYYIIAKDASPAANQVRNPLTGFRSFKASQGETLPFMDNFDGSFTGFYDSVASSGTEWQLGTPNYGATTGAHSAPNAWDVNLSTIYGANAEAYLYSPIFDFSTTVDAVLSFWMNYNTESSWDGSRIDYTTDGSTWTVLGTLNDPNGTNWYNYSSLYSSSQPGWAGSSGGWIQASYLLSVLNNAVGPVQFRYAFTSDGGGEIDGFSIDDFQIIPPLDTQAVMISTLVPDLNSCVSDGIYNVQVSYKNDGLDNIVPPYTLAYVLDGVAPVTQIVTDTLHVDEIDTLTFSTPMTLSVGNHHLETYISLDNDQFLLDDTLSYDFNAHGTLSLPYFNFLDTPASLNDFCIVKGAFGRVFQDSVAANTGAGGVVLDASGYNGWNNTPDTVAGTYYIWNPTLNPDQYSGMTLTLNSAGYSNLVLKFDAKQIYLWDAFYTNFRVTVNDTMITPHMVPNGATTSYITYEYDLSSLLPAPVITVVFEAKNYDTWDYSYPNGSATFVDNIQIYEPPAQEARLIKITAPSSGCGLGQEHVTLQIKNTGSDTISGNLQASYIVNGLPPVTPENITSTFYPGDTITYTFTASIDMSVINHDSTFNIQAWVALTGDPFTFNDSASQTIVSRFIPTDPVTDPVVVIPYATDTLLHAHATGNLYWFNDPTGMTYLVMDSIFQTPVLYDTTLFYVEARNGAGGNEFVIGHDSVLNTTTSYPSPYGQYYNGSHEQYIIPASELTAAGMGQGPVTALAFNVVSPAGDDLTGFTIKLGQTNAFSISSWVNGLTQVYTNASQSAVPGWNVYNFTTPFIWDGTSGLVVDICFDNYPNGYTTNGIVRQSSTAYTSCVGYHSDNGGVCTSGTGSTYYQRPNIKFSATPAGCPSNRIAVEVQVSGIPPLDAGVIAIDSPYTAVNLGAELVSVRVRNFGTNAISNFPVSYSINGQSPVTETITATINPGDTMAYTFTTPADLTVYNTYLMKAWSSLVGDTYAINDTAYKTVDNEMPVYCDSYATSSYDDDITSVSFAGINNNSPTPYTATYTDYTALAPAHVFKGGVYPISIGIGFSGTYGYSGYCEAYIDFNADGQFTEPDELVWGGAYTNSLTQILTGNVTIPATATSGMTTMRIVAVESATASTVVPCGSYSYGETEDYRVYISPILHKDAGIAGFTSPASSESMGANLPFTVNLKNNGLDTLNSVDIYWDFNNTGAQLFNWSGTIYPGAVLPVSVGNITLGGGMNDLLAYTVLPGDSNSFNDTARAGSFGLPPVSMFYDNFEDSLSAWTTNTNSMWMRGIPISNVINAAYSPTKCYKTRLQGNYISNRNDTLTSPKLNFTGITGPVLRFYHWWEADPNDGGNIQYSINGGASWITLGVQNDTAGINWYNHFTNGKYFWSGNYGGWRESIRSIPMVANQSNVKFRFIFSSDASTVANGWAIDDFEIRVPKKAIDAGVTEVINPATSIPGGMVLPKVKFKNYGIDTLLTVPVAYVITGGGLIVENWYGILPPDSVAEFTFANSFIMPGGSVKFCSFTGLPADAYRFNDSVCMMVYNNTGIDEYLANGFALGQNIPNPASSTTIIPFFIPEDGKVVLKITSLYGQVLSEYSRECVSGNNQIELGLQNFAPGLYYYTLEYKGGRKTLKMLIER